MDIWMFAISLIAIAIFAVLAVQSVRTRRNEIERRRRILNRYRDYLHRFRGATAERQSLISRVKIQKLICSLSIISTEFYNYIRNSTAQLVHAVGAWWRFEACCGRDVVGRIVYCVS